MTEKFSIAEIIEATNKLSDKSAELKKKVKIAIDPQTEKIILEAEEHLNKSSEEENVYILEDDKAHELKEESSYLIDEKIKKNKNFESENLNDISRGFKNINKICEILKEKNTELETNIKDYQSGKMYIKQKKRIQNLNNNNKELKNNIVKLKMKESKLRTEITDLFLDKKNIADAKNKMIDSSKNLEDKIKFYSEENAKISVEKHEITKKLKNSQSQLFAYEQDKKEIKVAVDNLNSLLSNSNVDTLTFKNKIVNSPTRNKKNSRKILKDPKIK